VGDIAGMGADLFGSFAESTCASLVIGGNSITTINGLSDLDLLLFVLLIPTVGIFVSIIISGLIVEGEEVTENKSVEKQLKKQLINSTVLLLPALYLITYFFMS
jgi:inorganic pyrophosphatase